MWQYVPSYNIHVGDGDPSSLDFDYDAECVAGRGPACATLAGAIGWLARQPGIQLDPAVSSLILADYDNTTVLTSSVGRAYCMISRVNAPLVVDHESFAAPA